MPTRKLHQSLLAVAISLQLMSCDDNRKERNRIRGVFRDFKQAIENGNGGAAAFYLDAATIKYYDHIADLIKHEDSIELQEERFDKKLTVLIVRHTASKQRIATLDGPALYEFLIKTGGFNAKSPLKRELRNIQFQNAYAVAEYTDTTSQEVFSKPSKMIIRREKGLWKLNLSSMLAAIDNTTWQNIFKERGQTELEAIDEVLEDSNGKKPDNAIWHKPSGLEVDERGTNDPDKLTTSHD